MVGQLVKLDSDMRPLKIILLMEYNIYSLYSSILAEHDNLRKKTFVFLKGYKVTPLEFQIWLLIFFEPMLIII